MKEDEQPSPDLLEKMYLLTELRRQKLKPVTPGFYRENKRHFWSAFSNKSEVEIKMCNGLALVGNPAYFDDVFSIVNPELERIAKVSNTPVDQFFIFIGDGETMEKDYRKIGASNPPYPFAINSALDCYLNTDWFISLGINHPAVRRAISHEPRHVAWSLALKNNGIPTYQTDKNRIIHEALGGPLDIEEWSDVPDIQIPPDELDESSDLYEWLSKKQKDTNLTEEYFLSPVVKAFYQWAKNKGDDSYWFAQAQKIPYQ